MRVKIDDRIARVILEDVVEAARVSVRSMLDIGVGASGIRRVVAERLAKEAAVAAVASYRIKIPWSPNDSLLDPKGIARFVGIFGDGDEITISIWNPGFRFKGMTCEMSEERLAAERLRAV